MLFPGYGDSFRPPRSEDHAAHSKRALAADLVAAMAARGYRHWSFLSQPAPLPERLIGADPQAYFDLHVRSGLGLGADADRYPPEVMAAYLRVLEDPSNVEAICEDYRAGATIDVALDDADRAAGRRIACPVLALWGARGSLPVFYDDVVEVWREWADDVAGHALDATHFLVEDRPAQTAERLLAFFADYRGAATRP
jgi:haloacetate dehalogenase